MRAVRVLNSLFLLMFLVGCPGPSTAELSDNLVARCTYTSPRTRLPECKEYRGEWDEAAAEADCRAVVANGGLLQSGRCVVDGVLGECRLAGKPAQEKLVVGGGDTSQCGINRTGCEVFGGGRWVPSPACGGAEDEGLVVTSNPFIQNSLRCVPPLPGERPGASDGGLVCTWSGMHGATEEGRRYLDYQTCDVAFTQRGYAPVPPDPRYLQPDSRREDPAYLAEEGWVKGQIRAQSCVCCHSNQVPSGGAIFGVDREGSFANQFTPSALALGAGWMDSTPLGAFPPERNNGFRKSDLSDRSLSAFMSTDPARMKRFFEKELEFRGITRTQVATFRDPLAPLTDGLVFRPEPCGPREGIAANGLIRWLPGKARYLYVLEAGAQYPTIPPNLDLPPGTLWRLDLPPDGQPVASESVQYGVVPEGMVQRAPHMGAPPPLESGKTYFLAVFADVLLPISRCLFTAP